LRTKAGSVPCAQYIMSSCYPRLLHRSPALHAAAVVLATRAARMVSSR
jgi:hypothetical protein